MSEQEESVQVRMLSERQGRWVVLIKSEKREAVVMFIKHAKD